MSYRDNNSIGLSISALSVYSKQLVKKLTIYAIILLRQKFIQTCNQSCLKGADHYEKFEYGDFSVIK